MPLPRVMMPVKSFADVRKLTPPNYDYAYFADHDGALFRAHADAYDPVNAWWLSELSFLAYASDVPFIEAQLKAGGFDDGTRLFGFNKRHPLRSTQCFVATADDAVFVVFRGTLVNEPWDVAIDLMSAHAKWDDGTSVHLGFRMAVNEVYAEVSKYVRELTQGGRPVWVTGHSLGAAVATLFAARFHADSGPIQGACVFGSPRVGSPKFAQGYNAPLYRVTNSGDPVAYLPARSRFMIAGRLWYEHVGMPVWITPRGKVRVGEDAPASSNGTAYASRRNMLPPGARATLTGRRAMRVLADHQPQPYCTRLFNAGIADQQSAPPCEDRSPPGE